MPPGIPLTYQNMIEDISCAHCKIVLPGLSDDKKSDKRFLKSRLGKFYDRCVRARLRAPGNEKKDQIWTMEETGLEILPMELKKTHKNHYAQVGDYLIEYSINGEPWINSGLVLERKKLEDAFNTFIFNYDRFLNELSRVEDNPELFRLKIIIEGTLKDLLNCTPMVPAICKCCDFCQPYHNNAKKIHNYNCTFDVLAGKAEKPKLVIPTGTCDFCVPHKKTEKELEDIRNRLRAIIEDFEAMGYSISFYNSRELAQSMVKDIAKRHFVANYARLLDI